MSQYNSSPLLVVTGPTATGKTNRGVDLARCLGGEIVSADSRQIYCGMDIGTGKDLSEYGADTPYHLIDIAPAGYKYNLFEYLRDANTAIEDIRSRGRLPIVVGGTGLYVESLVKGVRLPQVPENAALRAQLAAKTLPELTDILASMKRLHNTTDVDTVKRAIRAIEIETYYRDHPEMSANVHPDDKSLTPSVIIGIALDRDERRSRISRRLHARLNEGMVDEVRNLLNQGIAPDDLIYYGLEYKFVTLYLTGAMTYDEMVAKLEIAIHQFAKRQMTWFRGMERRGFKINWLPHDMEAAEFVERVKQLMEECVGS